MVETSRVTGQLVEFRRVKALAERDVSEPLSPEHALGDAADAVLDERKLWKAGLIANAGTSGCLDSPLHDRFAQMLEGP